MPAVMQISADDAERLRQIVRGSQNRRVPGRRVPVTFHDGPLAGVRVAVPESEARARFIGWCLPTPEGLIQVMYRRDGQAWHFRGVERGPR